MSPTAARHPGEPQSFQPQPPAGTPPGSSTRPEAAYSGVSEEGPGDATRHSDAGAAAMDEQGFKFNTGDICGDWEIKRFVAAGGMGEVYEVYGTFGRLRGALKCVRTLLATRADVEQRFETEVEILAALACPYIVRLLHAGRHRGTPYLVMEWLEGMTLRDYLHHQREPIPLAEGLHYAICIARALCVAHSEQIFHRDLKPENIFMLEMGTLKVLDFGLGKWAGSTRVSTSPQAGGGLCTIHYAAPEQLEGTGVDDRTDVRALAIIFVEMVTFRWLWADKPRVLPNREIALANQLNAAPPPLRKLLPGCPKPLAALIDAALSRDKTKRPHSTEFLAGLQEARRAWLGAGHASASQIENEESAHEVAHDTAASAAPAAPAQETSVVRLIRQLRTEALPPNQPRGNPTAAGNARPPPTPRRPPTTTVKMVARPSEADLEAARRAKAARDAVAAQGMTLDQAGEVTRTGRSATLPPEPSASAAISRTQPASETVFAAPTSQPSAEPVAPISPAETMNPSSSPTPQGQDESAAARASLELASRATSPWPGAIPREGTSSLSPTHSALAPTRSRIPMWTAPFLGAALMIGAFMAFRGVRALADDSRATAPPMAAASATAAATSAPSSTTEATSSPTAPTATATASASAALAALASPAPTEVPTAVLTAGAATSAAAPTPPRAVTPSPATPAVVGQAPPLKPRPPAERPKAPPPASSPTAAPAATPQPPAAPPPAPTAAHRMFGSEN